MMEKSRHLITEEVWMTMANLFWILVGIYVVDSVKAFEFCLKSWGQILREARPHPLTKPKYLFLCQ